MSTETQDFVEALSLLQKYGDDAETLRNIVWELAKSNPRALMEVACNLELVFESIRQQAIRIVRGFDKDRKIPCVKEVRALTGWSLKESKDFVEEIRPDWVHRF